MRDWLLSLLVSTLAILCCVFPERGPAQVTVASASTQSSSSGQAATRTSDSSDAANSRKRIIVDFQSGEVDGINLRDSIDRIKAALGPSAVKEETEELEGESTKVHVLSFGDHKVYKHWNAFSWRDPIFVTKEGLRVGSSLGDFDKVYGIGQSGASEGPGEAVYYHLKPDHQFCVVVPVGCRPRNSCTVTEIWVW